jgi:glycosyltransferase involved in cell wall biosynthesis
MKPPKISIICPVWNGLPYLKQCITSVIDQDFADWEMLISDDGSTDGSRSFLKSLSDPRIRYYEQKTNLGIFGNLNFLFERAQASISQILCQDDYFLNKSSLSTIVDYWKSAKPCLGFVRFNHMQEPSRIPTIKLQQEMAPPIIQSPNAALWFFVFGNVPGNLSNVSLRTSLVNEVGGFNQALPFAGDFEFWYRASKICNMGVENRAVVFVRRHERVASNFLSLNGELYIQHLAIYESLIDKLSEKFNRDNLINYFNREIGSFHYRTGIRSALYGGKFKYLNLFANTRSTISWSKWKKLSACFPLAIFQEMRLKKTVKIARELLALEKSI